MAGCGISLSVDWLLPLVLVFLSCVHPEFSFVPTFLPPQLLATFPFSRSLTVPWLSMHALALLLCAGQ